MIAGVVRVEGLLCSAQDLEASQMVRDKNYNALEDVLHCDNDLSTMVWPNGSCDISYRALGTALARNNSLRCLS